MNLVRRLAAAAGLAVALLAPSAFPGVLEEPFTPLRSELEFRRDSQYGGDLDKEQKKELKAIEKSIAALEDPGGTLTEHLKISAKVTKSLMGAFPAEFETAGEPQPLSSFVSNILGFLLGELEAEFADISSRAEGVPGGSATQLKLSRLGEQFDPAIEAIFAATDSLAAIEAMARLHKLLQKADRILDKYEASLPE